MHEVARESGCESPAPADEEKEKLRGVLSPRKGDKDQRGIQRAEARQHLTSRKNKRVLWGDPERGAKMGGALPPLWLCRNNGQLSN